MKIEINSIAFGYRSDDFMQNNVSVALECKGAYATKFRTVYITKPSRIYKSIGSIRARIKWVHRILPKYYIRQILAKQLKAVSRLKKLNK